MRSLLSLIPFVTCLVALIPPADAAWQPGYEAPGFRGGDVHCGLSWEGRLVLGGDFEGAGCARSTGVVFVENGSFVAVPSPSYARLRPTGSAYGGRGVRALAVHDGALIAGGNFEIDGTGVRNVARWNGTRWAALRTSSASTGLEGGAVRHLAVVDGTLFASGDFDADAHGTPLPGMARWTDDGWVAVPVPPSGSRVIAAIDGVLYGGLSRWTGSAWEPLAPWTGTARVKAIDRVDGGIAYGGFFETIDGVEIPGCALRRDDGSFEALGGDITITYPYPPLGPETEQRAALAIASHGGRTFAIAPQGDSFSGPGGFVLCVLEDGQWVEAEGVEAWSDYGAETGDLLLHDGALVALLASRTLADVDGASALSALRRADATWEPLVAGHGISAPVTALEVVDGRIWAGTEEFGLLYETDAGVERLAPRARAHYGSIVRTDAGVLVAAAVDESSDYPAIGLSVSNFTLEAGTGRIVGAPYLVPSNFQVASDAVVRAVPWRDRQFVVLTFRPHGGPLETIFTEPVRLFLGVDEGLPGAPRLDGAVDAVVVHDGQPWYAYENQVFRLDGEPDETVVATLVGSFNGPVRALVSDGARLVVGGDFESVNATPAASLAAFADGAWSEVAAIDGRVEALATDGEHVVVGGEFTSIAGVPTRNLAVVRGLSVGAFADGPDGPLDAVAVEPGRLVIAGDFTAVGGVCAAGLARWDAPLGTVGIDGPDDVPDEAAFSFQLAKPAPNPFNAHTSVGFSLARAGNVRLRVIDASGRVVRTLVHASLPAGAHAAAWDGRDAHGHGVASGVYFAALTVDGRQVREKIVLVK